MRFSIKTFLIRNISILLFIFYIAPNPTIAQDRVLLNIESISNGSFRSKSPSSAVWLREEVGYTKIENERRTLVLYKPGDNIRSELMSMEAIDNGDSTSVILNYQFSPDESKVLLTLRIGENRVYYILDRADESITKLDIERYSKDIQLPKISPDNNHLSFIYEANIFVYNIDKREVIQLTKDATDKIINATSSVRFASVGSTREYQWSPDSRYIAFNQFNTEGVRSFFIINNLDSIYSTVNEFQYVKPGETLPYVRTGVIEVSTKKTTWLSTEEDPRNSYITHIVWNPNSNKLFIQQMNRKQNIMNVLSADIESGTTEQIFTESEDTFLEPFNLQWINDGQKFLWMSENDGWRHIYTISADGKNKQLITPGDFDVSHLIGADQFNEWVYFEASPKNTTHNYGYRVKVEGSGSLEKLTPEDFIGTNHYQVSPNGKWAFRSFSRFDTPWEETLIRLPNHTEVKIIEDNAELVRKIEAINPSPVEYSKVKIEDGVALDSWVIKPSNFDPEKKYPVILHVYSMPAVKMTNDSWKSNHYFFYQLLAKKGFIVMGIDGRGTPSLEGRAWRKSIYLKHGVLPADDIAKATQIMLKERPFMDPERIGVYGWSGGGLMSLMLIFRHPEIFNTAIAGAYLSHHKYYYAGFTEKFLGLPQENADAYEETAVLNYAKNLKGNLLLIHGTGDDNVHYQNTEALINKLIEEKKRFVVLPYPNRTHNMAQGKNTKYHQLDTYYWFFTEHLMSDE